MDKMKFLLWIVVLNVVCLCGADRKNVLFLVSDDMRPELTSYLGPDFPSPVHPRMRTPHLDELAAGSLLLKRAYCQQAYCSPSRSSLLTGRRPDTTHVYDLEHYFRHVGGNFTTLPQYFKQHGYRTVGMGKIFHPGVEASGNDDPPSWTDPYYHAPNEDYWTTYNASWVAVDKAWRKQKPLPDDQTMERAMQTMRELASNPDTPFFLAVGFLKPHLPFVFPAEFLDLYPASEVHVPDNQYAPRGMPTLAWHPYPELLAYKDIAALNATGAINTTLPASIVRDLRRAYYSAVSYVDSLVGVLLRELKDLGLMDKTIVSFWGDHGYQLGEHGEWTKHTNFELATHAPMMVRVPGVTDLTKDQGIQTEELTEYVDLFPTLAEAAGLPTLPLCPSDSSRVALCREGMSLMPLMMTGGRNESAPNAGNTAWKQAAFSQYPRPPHFMGYTVRIPKYRYTEWVLFRDAPFYQPVWTENSGTEMYDHLVDPEENENLADDPGYAGIKAELSRILRAGWRYALPDYQDAAAETELKWRPVGGGHARAGHHDETPGDSQQVDTL